MKSFVELTVAPSIRAGTQNLLAVRLSNGCMQCVCVCVCVCVYLQVYAIVINIQILMYATRNRQSESDYNCTL